MMSFQFSGVVVAIAGLTALSSAARAAVVPTIDFDVATDFTQNFAISGGNGTYSMAHNAGTVLFDPSTSSTSVLRYDTNVGDGAHGPSDFLTETLQTKFAFSALGSDRSAGLFTRIQSDNKGILALLNPTGSTGLRLRLLYGADTASAAAGTAFYDATFNLGASPAVTPTVGSGGVSSTNPLATSLTLTLTQTAAIDPVFNLTISDAGGFVASTGDQVLASSKTDAYDGAGSAGLRVNLTNEASTLRFDDFSAIATAVPEPTTLAGLALGGLLALRRGRREA